MPGPDELSDHPACLVHRDRETQADAASLGPSDRVGAERVNGGVYPDHLTAGVDQRSTRIAGVDRRISLNCVEEDLRATRGARSGLDGAADRADNSARARVG